MLVLFALHGQVEDKVLFLDKKSIQTHGRPCPTLPSSRTSLAGIQGVIDRFERLPKDKTSSYNARMKIRVFVTPNASVNTVGESFLDERGQEVLRIRIQQVPEKGKANKAVLELLSTHLKVEKKKLLQISGFTSRFKTFEIKR